MLFTETKLKGAGQYSLQSQSRYSAQRAFSVPAGCGNELVRCTRGAILDIIVDLRPEKLNLSPTCLSRAVESPLRGVQGDDTPVCDISGPGQLVAN